MVKSSECLNPAMEDLLKFIKSMGSVTCGELSRRYGRGDSTIRIDNVIVALGLTQETADCILEAMNKKLVFAVPCVMGIMDWLVSDSPIPTDLKMAKPGKWGSYKTQRWYPSEFTTRDNFIRMIHKIAHSKKERDAILKGAGIDGAPA